MKETVCGLFCGIIYSPSCKIFVNGGMVIPFAVKGIYERYLARPPMTSSLFLGDMVYMYVVKRCGTNALTRNA